MGAFPHTHTHRLIFIQQKFALSDVNVNQSLRRRRLSTVNFYYTNIQSLQGKGDGEGE